MFTAVAGIVGALAIGAWAVVSWASTHRLPWLMAPLALLTVVLLVAGFPGWSLLSAAALDSFPGSSPPFRPDRSLFAPNTPSPITRTAASSPTMNWIIFSLCRLFLRL